MKEIKNRYCLYATHRFFYHCQLTRQINVIHVRVYRTRSIHFSIFNKGVYPTKTKYTAMCTFIIEDVCTKNCFCCVLAFRNTDYYPFSIKCNKLRMYICLQPIDYLFLLSQKFSAFSHHSNNIFPFCR